MLASENAMRISVTEAGIIGRAQSEGATSIETWCILLRLVRGALVLSVIEMVKGKARNSLTIH